MDRVKTKLKKIAKMNNFAVFFVVYISVGGNVGFNNFIFWRLKNVRLSKEN